MIQNVSKSAFIETLKAHKV